MFKPRFLSSLIIVCVLALALSTGGVFAAWSYYYNPEDAHYEIPSVINGFNYTPEEVLPGGGSGPVELGQDHFAIIKLIVNEADKGYNLNSSGSILHSLLSRNGTAHANQKISGGNLKFILDVSNNTQNLYYCVEKSSDTLYYIYTYSLADLEAAGGTDTEIAVYRTTVVKNDIWEATDSHSGYAKTVTLRSLGFSAASQSSNYTINVKSWYEK